MVRRGGVPCQSADVICFSDVAPRAFRRAPGSRYAVSRPRPCIRETAKRPRRVRGGTCTLWMALPKDRRNADELERQIRRIVDRALKDFREDQEQFGRKK